MISDAAIPKDSVVLEADNGIGLSRERANGTAPPDRRGGVASGGLGFVLVGFGSD